MRETHNGSCLCGAVRFTVSGPLRGVIYCHCTQCRKQTGHFFAATNVLTEHLAVTGEDQVTWYAASPDARRGFCATCGSTLFWKAHNYPYTSILAGAFDGDAGLVGLRHDFVADKAAITRSATACRNTIPFPPKRRCGPGRGSVEAP